MYIPKELLIIIGSYLEHKAFLNYVNILKLELSKFDYKYLISMVFPLYNKTDLIKYDIKIIYEELLKFKHLNSEKIFIRSNVKQFKKFLIINNLTRKSSSGIQYFIYNMDDPELYLHIYKHPILYCSTIRNNMPNTLEYLIKNNLYIEDIDYDAVDFTKQHEVSIKIFKVLLKYIKPITIIELLLRNDSRNIECDEYIIKNLPKVLDINRLQLIKIINKTIHDIKIEEVMYDFTYKYKIIQFLINKYENILDEEDISYINSLINEY